ncbi:transporter [Sphingomonas oleivorans]|uniref:Transporter n=1 Tax=Sphingomonas oleivorans TaxID=1735121 RepID=A0A2T5G2A5_9SPHN|nr:efflux transporter outer membrane subunit [Sphingomonas oleivorans]PTQ13275.1 transporter [Sphingomonas oleivorans]
MIRRSISFALLPALAACAAGTNYRPPVVPVADAWRGAPNAPMREAGDWWTEFGDPVLDGLVATALAQNLDIEQAMARVDRARAGLRAAGAELLPAGRIEARAARERQSTESGLGQLSGLAPGFPRTVSQYDLSGGASWEIDLAGGLRRGREAAAYELEAAEASGAAMRITVAAETADAYVQLRTLQTRLAAATELEAASRRLVALVEQRHAADEASRLELEQARASAAATRATLPPLRAGIEAQLNRIAVLTGREPQAERLGLELPGAIPDAPVATAGTPGEMLRRRPDLVAAERRLAASHARIGVALAEYYPKLSLSALLGFRANAASDLLSGSANFVQGAAGLRWRLFDFGRIDAEVAAARGVEREALAAYRQAVLRAAEDLETAFAARAGALAQAGDLAQRLESAGHARRLAEQAWRAGEVSLIEVIDADRNLLEARSALAASQGEAARAAIACYRALGGR